MDLELRTGVGIYLRQSGEYVVNRVGAITNIDFELWEDHDWPARECLTEARIVVEFDYWDSSHTHSVCVGHIIDGDELIKFLATIARGK